MRLLLFLLLLGNAVGQTPEVIETDVASIKIIPGPIQVFDKERNLLAHCDADGPSKWKDCKIAEGHTLDEVMTVIALSELNNVRNLAAALPGGKKAVQHSLPPCKYAENVGNAKSSNIVEDGQECEPKRIPIRKRKPSSRSAM